jgi:TonB family protein
MPQTLPMPRYPASEREAGNTGFVDVTMLVGADGAIQEIKSVTSEPRNIAFEELTKVTAAKWKFAPALKQCAPVPTDLTYRVLFQLPDGTENVRAVPRWSPAQTALPNSSMTPLNHEHSMVSLRYPADARRANAQGNVYLRLDVHSATGQIETIDIAGGSANKQEYWVKFVGAAIEVVRKFKYAPVAGTDELRSICVPIVFALR